MHSDKEHYHVHICASGIEYGTGKAMRMTKPEFAELKTNIQDFQRKRFPELSKSIVQHGRTLKKELALSDTDYQIRQRTGRASHREQIISILNNCYKKTRSRDEFFRMLSENGLQTYMRGGKTTGIILKNRKFRLKRLGLSQEMLNELNLEIRRKHELERLRRERGMERGLEMER